MQQPPQTEGARPPTFANHSANTIPIIPTQRIALRFRDIHLFHSFREARHTSLLELSVGFCHKAKIFLIYAEFAMIVFEVSGKLHLRGQTVVSARMYSG